MKIVLHLKNLDDQTTQEIILDRAPILLGRSKICEVPISDPILSRQHCSLEIVDENSVKLRDLDSANGTFVSGQKVVEKVLKLNDKFQLGRTEVSVLRIEIEAEEKTLEEILLEQEVSKSQNVEVTLKTPTILKSKPKAGYQTKDWVQVSILWKGDLVDIRCFDIGDLVQIGESAENDFLVQVPSLPKTFKLLKILPNGVELHLHPAMTGMLETRGSVKQLDELRSTARQTDLGLSTFVQFSDRCLIEIGPFSIYVQSIRLNLAAPLTAPIVREPLYAGIFSVIFVSFVAFALTLHRLAIEASAKTEKAEIVVTVEAPTDPNMKPPPPPPPPPKVSEPKKVEAVKVPQQKAQMSGKQGEGARAKGEQGKAGRTTGRIQAKTKPLGIVTEVDRPLRAAPKGAFGKETDPNRAKRGLRPDQGVGTGKPKPAGTGGQAPSKQMKPDVKVEDEGLLGALGAQGGGGKANQGGTMAGQGLGGELEGSLEGQERGADLDVKGAGGRGAKGLNLGGGGTAIDVQGGLGTKGKGGGREGFGLGSSGKKGEAAISYSGEDVDVQDGLTREEVERVVRANMRQVQACYERALINAGGRDLKGRLRVLWTVMPSGRVENTSRLAGEELGDQLYNCVAQAISTWQFPQPRGGGQVQVTWPWTFHGGL